MNKLKINKETINTLKTDETNLANGARFTFFNLCDDTRRCQTTTREPHCEPTDAGMTCAAPYC